MERLNASVKYAATLALCFVVRLLPHLPNVEPVMSAQVPAARRFGPLAGFGFGVASIFAYDAVTSGIGSWTVITGLVYGLVGVAASLVFRRRANVSRLQYAGFAFFATIAYDAITMAIGPLTWGQPWAAAIAGQIPFTMYHLIGNVTLAAVVSPALYAWLAPEPETAPAAATVLA